MVQRLCDATFADKVFFTNSGAEALECAIKMARKLHPMIRVSPNANGSSPLKAPSTGERWPPSLRAGRPSLS
jgi:hypothetical protein